MISKASEAQTDEELKQILITFAKQLNDIGKYVGADWQNIKNQTIKAILAWHNRLVDKAVKEAELKAYERLASNIINRFDLIAHLNNDPTAHGFTPHQLCKALQEYIPVKGKARA